MGNTRKILQKIAWKTNKWTTKINLLSIYLGGDIDKFGFQILNIDKGIFWKGSLFEITWCFPTVTHGGKFNIDILFIFEKWDKWCSNSREQQMWGSKLNLWERFNCYINDKITSIR